MSPESNSIPEEIQLEVADSEGMFNLKLNKEMELRENAVYAVFADKNEHKSDTEEGNVTAAQTNP